MDSYEYAKSITPESQALFEAAFSYYIAGGASFDGAMQTAIMDEQRFIERCRAEAEKKGE